MGRTWLNWILLRYLDFGSYKRQHTRREVRYETELTPRKMFRRKIPDP